MSQLERTQNHSAIIQGQDGRMYRITDVTDLAPADEFASSRQQRQQLDYRRSSSAQQVSYLLFGIGLVFLGAIGLMIFGAVLAAAVRPSPPPPPPAVNSNCIAFCNGG